MLLEGYQWPAPLDIKPFKHQKITVEFLISHPKAFCFNEQGTGKTASVIWATDYLMNVGAIKRVLVICPLSIMRSAWQQDLFNFATHRRVAVAHHAKAEVRKQLVSGDAEYVIVNFDGVEIVKKEIINGKFDLIVIDEASAYKNAQTTRWKCMRDILPFVKGLWMLTGTPAAQSPADAYGLAKLVNPQGVPKFFGQYRDLVMQKLSMYKWIPRPNADKIVHKALQPAIRFEKSQCLDLPPITYLTREAPMSAQQRKYYDALKDELHIEAAGEEISAVNAAVKINKLLQIACGAAYSNDKNVVDFDVSPRLAVVEEVISEASHKVLVFVPFSHTIALLQSHLTKKGISSEVIDGSVSVNKRTDIVTRFQNSPTTKVLIIQPQAASHGLTLTAADTIIWYAPVTSVETYLQANARIDRPGQKNNMTVVHIRSSPIEGKLYLMLRSGIREHNKLVDLYREEIVRTP
jgi:SNF2 family DNA or RNA helicase